MTIIEPFKFIIVVASGVLRADFFYEKLNFFRCELLLKEDDNFGLHIYM